MPSGLVSPAILFPAVLLGFFGGFKLWVLGGLRVVHNERFGKLIARIGMFLCWGSLIALLALWGGPIE